MTPLLEANVGLAPRLTPTTLSAERGERIALIGPNGSGKSTLLRALAGIEGEATALRIDDKDLLRVTPAARQRLVSFLPASRDVRWPIPVRDVIALGLAEPDHRRVVEVLERLHLEQLAERPVDLLSTGERTRALLGRALAPCPKLLLLDEPLSNLDPAWVLRILDLLDEVASGGTAIILALHDLAIVERFERVWMLDGGKVVADTKPAEILAMPAFAEAFGVEPHGRSWKLRPLEDPRSSR